MEKTTPTIMKNQRPTIAWRIWSLARRALASRNRSTAASCWPNVLVSRIPLTLTRLLRYRADVSQALLRLGGNAPADLAHAVGQVHEERQQPEREERQLPAEHEHGDDRRDNDHQVGKDAARGVGHDGLDAADIVGQPALNLARPSVGKEAQWQPLQVRVEGVAQVLHDALADDVVEVRLADADQAAHDGHQDHQADIEVELGQVLAGQRVVDERLQ
jgi:hypothetical protein